jgi:hypothetical protein
VTPEEKIRLIEQDRRRRERDWLILLLLLLEECIDDVATAMRHGFSVVTVLNNVLSKAIVPLSRIMASAHVGAMRRFARLTQQTLSTDQSQDELARQYEPHASEVVRAMVNSLVQSIADAQTKFPDEAKSILAQSAFDNAGLSKADKTAIRLGAERAIVLASNAGMFVAASQGGATGLAHHSVIDDVTTDLCMERDGLKLPINSTFWLSNCPPLHWNCRSVLLPIIGPFLPSTELPTIQPALGFGLMPLGFLQAFGIAA